MNIASRLAIGVVFASPLVVLATRPAAQQAPPRDLQVQVPAGTASIAGVVVSDERPPAPVRRARVTVRSDSYGNGWSATTDDEGRFAVRGVPAGRYTVEASKPAWLTSSYGATRAGRPGTPVVVADGARVADISIRMSRGAVITGTVTDRAGQQMPGVAVSMLRSTYSEITGEKTLVRTTAMDATSDDQGSYRIYGISPGEYVVVATFRSGPPTALMDLQRVSDADLRRAIADAQSPTPVRPAAAPGRAGAAPSSPLVGFAPVYYPSATDVGRAARVSLSAGEERSGVNIAIDPVPTARVDVTPRVPDTANPSSLQVYLVAHQSIGLGAAAMTTGRRDAEGRIAFPGVTPGTYTVIARAAAAGTAVAAPAAGRGRGAALPLTFYATAEIAIDGRDVVVPLDLREGMTVSGRVVFDDATKAPADPGVSVALLPFASGPALSVPSAPADASGMFQFKGVPAGRYRLEYSAARVTDVWTLASVQAGGKNVLDSVFDVRAGEDVADVTLTFTSRVSELTGRLQSSSGQPAPNYYIIVFSTERAFWLPMSRRVRQVRPAIDGGFSLRGLPPGDYFVAALTDVEPGQWHDAAFLAQLVSPAARVTIREGEKTTQDLRIK